MEIWREEDAYLALEGNIVAQEDGGKGGEKVQTMRVPGELWEMGGKGFKR